MPRRRSQYAVHIVLTDHYIQRNKPAGNLTGPIDEPEGMPQAQGNLVLFYPQQLPDSPENELYLASAELKNDNTDKNRIAQFETNIEKFKQGQTEESREFCQVASQSPNESIRDAALSCLK
jgi:hypothetical protein